MAFTKPLVVVPGQASSGTKLPVQVSGLQGQPTTPSSADVGLEDMPSTLSSM